MYLLYHVVLLLGLLDIVLYTLLSCCTLRSVVARINYSLSFFLVMRLSELL